MFAMPVTVGQAVAGGLGFGRDTWAVEAQSIYVIMKVSLQSDWIGLGWVVLGRRECVLTCVCG